MTEAVPRRLDHELYALQVLARSLLDDPEEWAIDELLHRIDFRGPAKQLRLRTMLVRMGCRLLLFQCRQARAKGQHLGYPGRAVGGVDRRRKEAGGGWRMRKDSQWGYGKRKPASEQAG